LHTAIAAHALAAPAASHAPFEDVHSIAMLPILSGAPALRGTAHSLRRKAGAAPAVREPAPRGVARAWAIAWWRRP
jgi:hypothetical protein